MIPLAANDLHLIVGTLAGSASITVHKFLGPQFGCLNVGTVVLDPDEAHALAEALHPSPDARQRVRIRHTPTGLWGVTCPACDDLYVTFLGWAGAIAAADVHLQARHREGAST